MSARAFAYLTAHSAKNRLLSRIKRAKNPRYALAVILGGAYLWMVYLRPVSSRQTATAFNTTSTTWMVIGTAVLLVMTGIAWFVPNGPSSLAMDKAEMSFILAGPVTRRGLIGYKTLRAQLAIMMTVIVWTLLMRRGTASLPLPLRAIGVWIFFTTTNLHRTGAEIVRAAWSIRGEGALRKHWIATGAIIAVIIGLAISLGQGYPSIVAAWDAGIRESFVALGAAMSAGPARVVLWPVHAVLRPMIADSMRAWFAAIPAALIVLSAHVLWVFRVDDEAVEVAVVNATANLEVLRSRAGRSKVAGPALRPRPDAVLATLPLSSSGRPAMAIVWKNFLGLRRKTRSTLPILLIVSAIPIVGAAVSVILGKVEYLSLEAVLCVAIAVLVLLFGPLMARIDLRDDMLNLSSLKLFPLRGRTIVAAEVLSVVVPIAVIEFALLAAAAALMQLVPEPSLSPTQSVMILAAALPATVAFTGAFVGIQNAAPVLFPAWVKLGAITNGGIEAMGQMMIVFALFIVLLVVMILPAGAVTAGIIFAGRSHPAPAIAVAMLVGSLVLTAELAGLFAMLGRALDRTEPSDVPST